MGSSRFTTLRGGLQDSVRIHTAHHTELLEEALQGLAGESIAERLKLRVMKETVSEKQACKSAQKASMASSHVMLSTLKNIARSL